LAIMVGASIEKFARFKSSNSASLGGVGQAWWVVMHTNVVVAVETP